jgi:hypothetical protein
MSRAYFSAVLPHQADATWAIIRSFDHYAWAGVKASIIIEDERSPNEVGSVRSFMGPGGRVRQVLIAHSDADRSYSYAFVSAAPMEMRNYRSTIRVAPVTRSGDCFVEWWAEFDDEVGDGEATARRLEQEGFAVWVAALASHMDQAATSDAVRDQPWDS